MLETQRKRECRLTCIRLARRMTLAIRRAGMPGHPESETARRDANVAQAEWEFAGPFGDVYGTKSCAI